MALVVLLRGVNVGGHKTFRPSVLAKQLSAFDVVNIGAAGTFVVRKAGTQARFRAALARKLPFATAVAICEGRDFLRLERENPFRGSAPPGVVRFLSVMTQAGRVRAKLPVSFPPSGQWLVRIVAARKRFVFGMYRRHMKTIGYLGQTDKLVSVPVTTRNWNTVLAIVKVLREG